MRACLPTAAARRRRPPLPPVAAHRAHNHPVASAPMTTTCRRPVLDLQAGPRDVLARQPVPVRGRVGPPAAVALRSRTQRECFLTRQCSERRCYLPPTPLHQPRQHHPIVTPCWPFPSSSCLLLPAFLLAWTWLQVTDFYNTYDFEVRTWLNASGWNNFLNTPLATGQIGCTYWE